MAYRLTPEVYSQNGYFFVTICTQNKENFFGNIHGGRMKLSVTGEIVHRYWYEIPNHFSYVILDAFVVMPDHVHGIIGIDRRDAINRVSTDNNKNGGVTGLDNPMLCKGLSTVMRWYKGRCSFEIHRENVINHVSTRYFSWQPRFYDHVIRNEKELEKIREYIINNPIRWEQKKEHSALCSLSDKKTGRRARN